MDPNDITSDDTTESKVVKNQLYWNDQECRQENWFVCSKRITNPNKRENFVFVITLENSFISGRSKMCFSMQFLP